LAVDPNDSVALYSKGIALMSLERAQEDIYVRTDKYIANIYDPSYSNCKIGLKISH
jgi:hypothetical protein